MKLFLITLSKYVPCMNKVLDIYRDWHFRYLSNRDPRKNANKIFKSIFHRNIDWNNPQTLEEKIYWLQMFTDTSLWTLCADKFRIREYLHSKGLDNILPILYGHWENSNEIDFKSLPDKFVLKTNNGCGQVLLVEDKHTLDLEKTKKLLDEWMKLKYGFTDGQVHYSHIKPCIIAEEYLSMKSATSVQNNGGLIDQKIYCFHGKPYYVAVIFDRVILGENKGFSESAYDVEWNNISEKAYKKSDKHFSGADVPKPKSFEQMIEISKILSKDFIEVRLDFYDIDGKPYLGEMTFTTGYGDHCDDFEIELGEQINLKLAKRISGINRPPRVF